MRRRESVKDFRHLQVWEKAHQLTLEIYRVTTQFPRTETYGLTSQVRRASSSICANLAEGCGRNGDAELARFCGIARGSASELEITCCSPAISVSSSLPSTKNSISKPSKLNECSRH